MILKKDKGLTLIETIIVVALFTIIFAAIFKTLRIARVSWNSSGSQLKVQQETRRGLGTMIRELRQAQLSTIAGVPADGADYNSVTFKIPVSISETGAVWSGNIQYSLGGLDNEQLLRTQVGEDQRVLANNISTLTFSRNALTPEILNISITAQKDTFPGEDTIQSDITLASEVEIRN
ncbi:type II secretion system protein J [Candidatus Omnitrophota bacterium]